MAGPHTLSADDDQSRFSETEREMYEAKTADVAKEALALKQAGKTGRALEGMVQAIVQRSSVHEDLKLRMFRDVMRNLQELEASVKSYRERAILSRHEGLISKAGDTYLPAGVKADFRVRVKSERGWDWQEAKELSTGGGILNSFGFLTKTAFKALRHSAEQVFGRRVDAKEFKNLLESIQKNQEELRALERKLAIAKASENSVGELASKSASDWLDTVATKGVFSLPDATLGGVESFVGSVWSKYWDDDRLERDKIALEMGRKKMELKQQESLLKAVLDEQGDLSAKSRELYTTAFDPEVQELFKQKDTLSEAAYAKKVQALAEEISKASTKSGQPMEAFFEAALRQNDDLGFLAKKARGKERTPVERLTMEKNAAGFLRDIIGTAPSSAEAAQFLALLDEKNAFHGMGSDVFEGKGWGKKDIFKKGSRLLSFLVQGKGDGIAATLSSDRRLQPTAENLAEFFSRIDEYADMTGRRGSLDTVLETFASQWTNVSAQDFDRVVDLIVAGRKPLKAETRDVRKESAEAQRLHEAMKTCWQNVTGAELEGTDLARLEQAVDAKSKEFQHLFDNPEQQRVMAFLFQGRYGSYNRSVLFDPSRLMEPTFDNFMEARKRLNEFTQITGDPEVLEAVFTRFADGDQYRNRPFKDFNGILFKTIQRELRQEKVDAEAKGKADAAAERKAAKDERVAEARELAEIQRTALPQIPMAGFHPGSFMMPGGFPAGPGVNFGTLPGFGSAPPNATNPSGPAAGGTGGTGGGKGGGGTPPPSGAAGSAAAATPPPAPPS